MEQARADQQTGRRQRPGQAPLRVVGSALTIASLAALLLGCTQDRPAPEYDIGAASRADVTETIEASGTVTARASATVAAPAPGRVSALRVRPGQRVRAGEVLAVIDSPQAREQLKRAHAALNGAGDPLPAVPQALDTGAARRQAASAFAQARAAAQQIPDPAQRAALLTQLAAAEQSYTAAMLAGEQSATALRTSALGLSAAVARLSGAQREQARQVYQAAKSLVAGLTLRAPFAGVVQWGGVAAAGPATPPGLSDLLAGAGTAAGAGGATTTNPADLTVGAPVTPGLPLLSVVDTGEYGIAIDVDESDVLSIRPNASATVAVEAVPGAQYQAVVRSVDLTPTKSGNGVGYRARLTLGAGSYPDGRPAPRPHPGMSATADIAARSAADVVSVPISAVFGAEGDQAVWAVRAGRAERRPVRLGVRGADTYQVVAGLADGDRVVVRGTDRVHPGQSL